MPFISFPVKSPFNAFVNSFEAKEVKLVPVFATITVNLLFFNPTENLGSFQVSVSAAFSESAGAAATVVAEAEALNATVLGAKLGVGSINLTQETASVKRAMPQTILILLFIPIIL
jgi:hypothetical protein